MPGARSSWCGWEVGVVRKLIAHLRQIERAAYPPHMRQMQAVRSIEDLAEYCECRPDQVFVLSGEGWYFIAAEREGEVEVVDFASAGGCRDLFRVLAAVLARWRGRKVAMDCRARTSYPLVLALVRRYQAVVLEDTSWYWGDDEMRRLVVLLPVGHSPG